MIARLDRLWRLFVTAVAFALFGLGGLVLALVVFPAFSLLIRDPARREAVAQRTVHRTWRLYIEVMRVIGVLTFECQGEELLRGEHGALIIANHPSLLDIVFLMAFMERTQCVVKAGVWNNPFMSGVVKATNYIPNLGDPERLVEDCAAALQRGNNIVIFPEGSRTVPGRPRKIQRGFAYIALGSGAPIRLATITVTPSTLIKGEPWHRIPATKPHWTIRVHERISVSETLHQQPVSLAARDLCSRIDHRFSELLAS
jgi:1-acyl-sn-glycerol-3-phosphate acyltransferase